MNDALAMAVGDCLDDLYKYFACGWLVKNRFFFE